MQHNTIAIPLIFKYDMFWRLNQILLQKHRSTHPCLELASPNYLSYTIVLLFAGKCLQTKETTVDT